MYGGYISTPEAELYGEANITFRARRAGNSPVAGDLDLSLCDNTMGRLESKEFKLTTEWQEFSFTSKVHSTIEISSNSAQWAVLS